MNGIKTVWEYTKTKPKTAWKWGRLFTMNHAYNITFNLPVNRPLISFKVKPYNLFIAS